MMNLTNGLKRGRHCHDADNRDPRDVPHWLKSCPRSKSESGITTINDLSNALLEEIFVRLDKKSSHQGKCVSKRWLSLMSTPWFLRRFVRDKITFGTSNGALPLHFPFTLISRIGGQRFFRGIQNYRLMSSSNMVGSPDEFFLKFLPCHGFDIIVVGTSNDLLLCRVEKSPTFYYLCNPFTRHWVEIPLVPTRENDVYDDSIIGFICDPYYKVIDDHENGYHTVVNTPYRYNIVRLSVFKSSFIKVEIFSSETGQWSKLENSRCSRPLSPEVYHRRCSGGFASNGKLHWLYGSYHLFAYDPFNTNSNNSMVEVIDRPAKLRGNMNVHLGVCRGRLRLLKFTTSPGKKSIFTVWELEDYETGKWGKVGGFRSFPETPISVVTYRFLCTGRRERITDHASASFHPYDEDIVYLRFSSHVYSCNMRSRTFELLHKGSKAFDAQNMVFSLVQPWWPTLVSSLPSLT